MPKRLFEFVLKLKGKEPRNTFRFFAFSILLKLIAYSTSIHSTNLAKGSIFDTVGICNNPFVGNVISEPRIFRNTIRNDIIKESSVQFNLIK